MLLYLLSVYCTYLIFQSNGESVSRAERFFRIERSAEELGLIRKEEIRTMDNNTPTNEGINL